MSASLSQEKALTKSLLASMTLEKLLIIMNLGILRVICRQSIKFKTKLQRSTKCVSLYISRKWWNLSKQNNLIGALTKNHSDISLL